MALPGFDFTAPEQAPARSGLYEAATVRDTTGVSTRVLEGVRVWPANCGPAGTWPSELCATTVTEIQNVELAGATTGDFILTFRGDDTATIPYDASIATVESALEALDSIGDVVVTGSPGDWVIEFVDPSGNVPLLAIDDTGTDGTGSVTLVRAGLQKGGDRVGPSDLFLPVTIWAWDECGPGTTFAEAGSRAQHILDLNERALVESAFAAQLIADAGAPAAAGYGFGATAALAVQALLGEGLTGVLHTGVVRVLEGVHQGVVTKTGAARLEQFGNPIAWGGGYEALTDLVIASGAVFIWRGETTVRQEFNRTNNIVMALAERTVLVAYEPCHVSAWTVEPIPSGGGGGGGEGFLYPSP